MAPFQPYDPTSEPTNREQLIAAHWECLRRNKRFHEVARNWVKSEAFRRKHTLSPEYHNPEVHFPRCALDWMITPEQRVSLSVFQRKKGFWFCDLRFNFGPIIMRQNFHLAHLSRKSMKGFVDVAPSLDMQEPLRLQDSWNLAPSAFKTQFAFACLQQSDLHETTSRLKDAAMFLRWFAARIIRRDRPQELQKSAWQLSDLGQWLHDEAEFHRVFHIPKGNYSRKTFDEMLQRIKKSFATEFRIDAETKYNRHKSYFGTRGDWKWFLMAEKHSPSDPARADFYELAKLYSEELRGQFSQRRKNVKSHGFRGTVVASTALRNRRRTLRRHIHSIQKWIARVYPPKPISKRQAIGASAE